MTDPPLAAADPQAALNPQAAQHVQEAQHVQDGWTGPAHPAPRAQSAEVLAIDGVSVRLAGREVLKDVTFSLRRGEFAGLIGSNGAGKTTLLRVILGLTPPATGEVRIDGRPTSRRGRARGGAIGYVPQKILLDPDMPVRARDLVGLGLDGQRLGLPRPNRARRERVDAMLRAVGAERFADARVGNLSGGEQQRVMIAHALISGPRLLLLDEPLANLDLRSEQEVVDLLACIAKEQQVAVLISAHEMNPLLPVMDRVVYLAAGRAASGPADEIVRTEVLSELYGHHVDVLHVHGRVIVVAGRGDDPHTPPGPDGTDEAW
jgi:zinc/manganese transport system ATP-binding protein